MVMRRSNAWLLVLALLLSGCALFNAPVLIENVTEGSTNKLFLAEPLYGYLKSPAGLGRNASNKAGADFLCLYLAAWNYGSNGVMYDVNTNPWRRTAVTFPPNLIYATAQVVPVLEFPQAMLLNNISQILLFFLSFFVYLRKRKVHPVQWIFGISLALFALFCTPVGTTWFERAQTDLYLASAYLFYFKGMRDDSSWEFVVAGLFLSLKWAGAPFFLIFGIIYLFLKPSRLRFFRVAVAGAIPFLMLGFFGANTLDYLRLLGSFEMHEAPTGMSLGLHVPRLLSKLAPLALVGLLLSALSMKTIPMTRKVSREMHYVGLLSVLSCTMATVAFEYRLVALLFLIPFLLDSHSLWFETTQVFSTATKTLWLLVLVFYLFRFGTFFQPFGQLVEFKRGLVPLLALLFLVARELQLSATTTPDGAESALR